MRSYLSHASRVTEDKGALPHDLTLAAHGAATPIHVGGITGPGTFDFFPGTTGDDNFTGTTGDDIFDLSNGGNDTAFGDAGMDEFDLGATFNRNDAINGGDGYDYVVLFGGDYSTQLKFSATTATNIEDYEMYGNANYNLKLNDASLTAYGTNNAGIGDSCAIFSNAGAGFTVKVDASAETDAAIIFTTGASDDTLIGGAQNDFMRAGFGTNIIDGGGGVDRAGHFSLGVAITVDLSIGGPQTIATGVTNTYIRIEDVSGTALNDSLTGNNNDNWLWGEGGNDQLFGGRGNDRLEGSELADFLSGGAGDDHYVYGVGDDGVDAATASTSTAYDTIDGFDFLQDHFELPAAVAAIDAKVKKGALNDATFDDDLAAAVKPIKLGAGDAVIFTPNSGDHAGETFLIIDHNGMAGYQASADVVIKLEHVSHLSSIDVTDFLAITE